MSGKVLTKNSLLELAGGVKIPLFGLGTWLARDNQCYEAVKYAIVSEGIRLIDTASLYQNEEEVGRAIIDSKVNREELFIVTKLHVEQHGYENTLNALSTSLSKLSLSYVDLYLIHTPRGGKLVETWKAMLELKERGLARIVGVSNFGVEQLDSLLSHFPNSPLSSLPSINQVELHVHNQQRELVGYCREKGITVMGYCPFARGKKFGTSEILLQLAQSHNKTEAQIMLRWSLQKGIITIPKSVTIDRIHQNCDIFDFHLSDQEMQSLEELHDGFEASTSITHQILPWDNLS